MFCPGGSGDHGYDVKQNVKREKKHADLQQFAIAVVFDPGCGLMAEEKAEEDSRRLMKNSRMMTATMSIIVGR